MLYTNQDYDTLRAMKNDNLHVAIIGSGIIGISCAAVLRRRGVTVTLIERDEPCAGTSSGNAGAIATSAIMPLASPGIMLSAPKWLLDPLGPLSIRPRYIPKIMPWLYKFWRASNAKRVRDSARSLASIMKITGPAVEQLFAEAGIAHCLHHKGHIHAYQSTAAFEHSRSDWELRTEFGIPVSYLNKAELHDMEPALGDSFTNGVLQPDWMSVTDPHQTGLDIANHAIKQGVTLVSGTVINVAEENAKPTVQLADGRKIKADKVVLAAGAWSHRLAALWGENIPLETERGYTVTMKNPGIELNRSVSITAHAFLIAPLSCGMRIAGTVEFGGLEAAPNYARANAMLKIAKQCLPGLNSSDDPQWMGFRPSTPDTLPVIGRSPIRPNIIHAYGHGHLGLTLCAPTAELVADIALDQTPSIDIHPFRADRF